MNEYTERAEHLFGRLFQIVEATMEYESQDNKPMLDYCAYLFWETVHGITLAEDMEKRHG